MANGHKSIKRIIHRTLEELNATKRIAKMTSWKKALVTLKAKIDIQIMNKNGYNETEKVKHHLLEKHDIMLEYYQKTFKEFMDNYKINKKYEKNAKDMSNCIWICWWQGLENAPEIVKKCVDSIVKNAENRKVIIITDENYKEYVSIPKSIEDKKNKGIITKTNYSDLLRLSLLAEHGGMWLDATFFCTGSLESYFNLPMWSIKRPDYGHASVACGNFAGYSLYCNKDNRWIFRVIRDFFINYWENNDKMVDYLMVDYMIVLAQRFDKEIKKAFDTIPRNNKNCDELYKVMNEVYDEKRWNALKEETVLFKLTWKQNFPEEKDGIKTFYGKLIDKEL